MLKGKVFKFVECSENSLKIWLELLKFFVRIIEELSALTFQCIQKLHYIANGKQYYILHTKNNLQAVFSDLILPMLLQLKMNLIYNKKPFHRCIFWHSTIFITGSPLPKPSKFPQRISIIAKVFIISNHLKCVFSKDRRTSLFKMWASSFEVLALRDA